VEYVRSLGLPADRIFTGFDVVDNDYFAREVAVVRAAPETFRQRLSLPDRYFLASARFVRKKNLSGLLDAYAGYLRLNGGETWPLVIVGDGELAGEIRNKIVEYGMTERVLTPGFVQYDALPAYYGLASAFVHASTTEQWGLVVNEAMASGLPVLVSKNCGCAEDLVEDGVNGFTFDPADPAALAASMSRMSSGALVLGAMGEASRRIISRWSPERFADGVVTACDAARRHAGSRRPAPVRRLFLRGMQIIRRPEAGAEFNAPGVS
jgi:glycosyltransferase involved in cell wall biosynthesis